MSSTRATDYLVNNASALSTASASSTAIASSTASIDAISADAVNPNTMTTEIRAIPNDSVTTEWLDAGDDIAFKFIM